MPISYTYLAHGRIQRSVHGQIRINRRPFDFGGCQNRLLPLLVAY